MQEKHKLLLYFIVTVIFYIGSGMTTYYIFYTNILRIFIFIVIFEILIFIIFNKQFFIIKRFIVNVLYICGYLIPLTYV